MDAVLLRKPDVCQRFGDVGYSTLYSWVANGLLPPQVKIGPRASAWPGSEIEAVAQARISGKSNEEIRSLVQRLVSARLKAA